MMHPCTDTIDRALPCPTRTSSGAMELRTARVLDALPPWFVLDAAPRARRAPSCLLVPRIGDVVLTCVAGARGEAHIVAVLESGAASPTVLELPPSTTIVAPRGTLSIRVAELRMAAGAVLLTAGLVTTRALRCVQLARESIRRVLWTDDTLAGDIRLHADQTLHLQGERSKLLGRRHVGIDADRIDLG